MSERRANTITRAEIRRQAERLAALPREERLAELKRQFAALSGEHRREYMRRINAGTARVSAASPEAAAWVYAALSELEQEAQA